MNRRSHSCLNAFGKPVSAVPALPQWVLVAWLALSAPFALQGQTPSPAINTAPDSAPVEKQASEPLWQRIVIVGASASAGFTESEPLGGPNTPRYRLSRYVEAALLTPHEPVRNLATSLFFLLPEAEGRKQIGQALRAKPTLVVGLDFLFWFCYGQGSTDADRLQQFDRGLKLLERIECPLVLGDIPDASGASQDVLPTELIPSVQAMAAANRRLRQWAAPRKQVVVLPLSNFMRTAMANEAFTVHGHTLPPGKTRALLQSDRLHPAPLGCSVLALTILDAVQATPSVSAPASIRWNPNEVARLVLGTLPKK